MPTYLIRIKRKSEDDYIFHATLEENPSREDIIDLIKREQIKYDDKHETFEVFFAHPPFLIECPIAENEWPDDANFCAIDDVGNVSFFVDKPTFDEENNDWNGDCVGSSGVSSIDIDSRFLIWKKGYNRNLLNVSS
jgi:hypothetical protein